MLISILAVILAATGACAQNETSTGMLAYSTAHRLPRMAAFIEDTGSYRPEHMNNINVSAVRDFIKRFHEPDSARWFKLKDASLIVRFDKPGIAFRVAYNRQGDWIYTMQTYREKQMPRDIRAIVKSKWYDYSITQVHEIEHFEATGSIYLVYIKDDTCWKILRVCNGEMEVLETINKR
ncbi:MAG TPA: hypothetical protein VLD19_11885 [Chitinophagaceae bacterium]|nr:hypothetical protein [Chitinophagaceae bacterium]